MSGTITHSTVVQISRRLSLSTTRRRGISFIVLVLYTGFILKHILRQKDQQGAYRIIIECSIVINVGLVHSWNECEV
jgi:hypothetical protein